MYLLNIGDADLSVRLHELDARQGLCQDVRELLICADEFDLHPALLHAISDEVIPRFDVFTAVVKDRVLTEQDRGLVVDLRDGGAGFFSSELAKEPRQPDALPSSCSGRSILRLTGAQGDDLLLLRLPGDDVVAEEEQNARGASPSVDVPCEVAVAEADKPVSAGLPLVVAAVVDGSGDVAQHSFHSCEVLVVGATANRLT